MSYENEVKKKAQEGNLDLDRVDIGVLRYLWQSGPFSLRGPDNLPRFLTQVTILNSFTSNELRIFSRYLHKRTFNTGEVVFRQGDAGYGFYFVFEGAVSVVHTSGQGSEALEHTIATLERYQYFGEMGLLQEYNRRNATIVATAPSTLIGVFKPDLEALLDAHPVVGAKFLREISLILANRLGALMETVTQLRHRLGESEAGGAP